MVLSGCLVCYLKQPAAVERSLLPPCQVNAVLGDVTCFCGHVIIVSWSDSLRRGDCMENNCHLPVRLPTLSILLISWALNWAGAKSNTVRCQTKWLRLAKDSGALGGQQLTARASVCFTQEIHRASHSHQASDWTAVLCYTDPERRGK